MKNKVALVTGASSGMGKDFAKALLNDNYTVYVAARRLENMNDLKGLGAKPMRMDITSESDVTACVDTIVKEQGQIDVLINNAGFGMYGAVEETKIEDARYQFDVNIFGLARLTQLVIPHMREKKYGKIINISSIGGKMYTPMGSWYHATKHALEGWSDCLRLELEPFGIDVVIVQPGSVQTEFGRVVIEPLRKRSVSGPYADVANKLADALKEQDEPGNGSAPSVITNVVMKAIRSDKPKTRYHAAKYSTSMLLMRWLFSDRLFDRIIMSYVK